MKKLLVLVFVLMVAITPSLALTVGTNLGFCTVEQDFGAITGIVGASNSSLATVGTGYLVKVDYKLAKLGTVQTDIGAYYTNTTVAGAVASYGLTWGASVPIASNLSMGADFILYSYTGATTATGILPGVAVTAALAL